MPKNVVCKKCNNLANDWCEKVIDSPDQDMQRDCQYFCEKTNADKIRDMTDNMDLIDIIKCPYTICQRTFTNCCECKLDWLQQPAEVEE